jgi:hypothetical protein
MSTGIFTIELYTQQKGPKGSQSCQDILSQELHLFELLGASSDDVLPAKSGCKYGAGKHMRG